MVTGQAPVTLELRNTPGKNTYNPRWYTHISQLTHFMPPPETYKSEIGSQSTMCQVQAVQCTTQRLVRKLVFLLRGLTGLVAAVLFLISYSAVPLCCVLQPCCGLPYPRLCCCCCSHINSHNQVRGYRTGSSHSGAEEYPREKHKQAKVVHAYTADDAIHASTRNIRYKT